MAENLTLRVLEAEKKGSDGHNIATYEDQSLREAILLAYDVWEIRQQERLEGLDINESELINVDISIIKKIRENNPGRFVLEEHDAYAALQSLKNL